MTSGPSVGDAVAAEVVRLHEFFEQWFADDGAGGFDAFDGAMGSTFYLVSPSGVVLSRSDIVGRVHEARGSGAMSISIERPVVRFDDGSTVISTYEEHQIRDGDATARASTVVMQRDATTPGGWTWLAVHETWITP